MYFTKRSISRRPYYLYLLVRKQLASGDYDYDVSIFVFSKYQMDTLVSKIFAITFLGVTNDICILRKGIKSQKYFKRPVTLNEKN